MPHIDIVALADILREAAKAEILPRFRRLDPETVHTKSSPTDLVTEADTEAERRIKAEIAKRWPGTLVVGEESVAADPALLGKLAGADVAITVDPVDGTANFAGGLPLFAVMASVVVKGENVGGIIYDPMGDDWFMAERGGGAWLRRPDGGTQSLKVADPVPLERTIAHVSIGFLEPKCEGRGPGQPRQARDLRELSRRRSRLPHHGERPLPRHPVQQADAMGPSARHADLRRGGRPCAQVRRLGVSGRAIVSGGLIIATDPDSWQTLRREVFTV